MLKKILYADSGNGHTQEMLKILQDIPAFQNSDLTILHVGGGAWEEGGKILADIVKNTNVDPAKVSTILRQGEPKDLVCQVADEIDADLILMGSRGLKRLESFLENSVSQYVFQLSDRPMLLVKDDIYIRRVKRVMLALDKSEAAQYALELTINILKDYKEAQLYLVRVNPDLDVNIDLSVSEMEQNPVLAPALLKAKRMNIDTRCLVTGGKPGKQICKLVEEKNIDLLLLGSPDRRPSIAKSLVDLDRLLGSSLSDYIRVNANCPVLLVRK